VTWNAKPYFARAVPSRDDGTVLTLKIKPIGCGWNERGATSVANVSFRARRWPVRLLIETLLSGALEEPETATHAQSDAERSGFDHARRRVLDLSLIESGNAHAADARRSGEIVAEQIIH
jgi:hypothetical protein